MGALGIKSAVTQGSKFSWYLSTKKWICLIASVVGSKEEPERCFPRWGF